MGYYVYFYEFIMINAEHIPYPFSPTIEIKTKVIYVTLLLGLSGIGLCLPFINLAISTQAPGTLRPLAEKTEIHPLVAGTITQLRAHENQTVAKGDTLLVLQSGAMQAQLGLNVQ